MISGEGPSYRDMYQDTIGSDSGGATMPGRDPRNCNETLTHNLL